jgi:hypothetical protein
MPVNYLRLSRPQKAKPGKKLPSNTMQLYHFQCHFQPRGCSRSAFAATSAAQTYFLGVPLLESCTELRERADHLQGSGAPMCDTFPSRKGRLQSAVISGNSTYLTQLATEKYGFTMFYLFLLGEPSMNGPCSIAMFNYRREKPPAKLPAGKAICPAVWTNDFALATAACQRGPNIPCFRTAFSRWKWT